MSCQKQENLIDVSLTFVRSLVTGSVPTVCRNPQIGATSKRAFSYVKDAVEFTDSLPLGDT